MQQEQNTPAQDEQIRLRQQGQQQKLVKIGLIAGLLILLLLALSLTVGTTEPEVQQAEIAEPVFESVLETDELRNAFKQALSEFEQEQQHWLDDPELQQWAEGDVAQLQQGKQQAINAFAGGTYSQGLSLLARTSEDLTLLVSRWDEAFAQKLQQARRGFEQDNINLATLALNQALKIKASDSQALELQQQLAVYPQVAQLLAELKIATVEQNAGLQIELMEQIVAIDPNRQQIEGELEALRAQQQEREFARLIESALDALDKGQLSQAAKDYQRASGMGLQSRALNAIAKGLKKQRTQLTRDALVAQVEELAQSDQWQKVHNITRTALKRFPADGTLLKLQQSSRQILRLQSKANGYLARPERLGDSYIAGFARNLIRQASPYVGLSATLANKVESVARQLGEYSQHLPLRITSDEKTFIRVLGEGQVGKVEQKTIQLPPGTYTLEGSRPGYKNKQKVVELRAGQPLISISLVCDERI